MPQQRCADRSLPLIWDADFMLGPPGADGTDSYVLGEINVSSVFRFPTGRRQRSPAELPIGSGRSSEWSERRPAMVGTMCTTTPGCPI